uniref:Protein KRI1 homolog n=1 Tax=Culicoides sonorensis TaxID=179676 RepID=A0A336MQ90_CULSO
MKKQILFEEESDNEDDFKLKTNEGYAKAYNEFRKKELLSHLKNKDLDDESSSSDDLSTDDEVVNPEFDKEFFKTLAYLKNSNPEKYKEKPKFFEGTKTIEEYLKEKHKKKEKPITIKDYKRELLLKHGPDFVEEDDDTIKETAKRADSPTYIEEQEKLRLELKKAFETGNSSDEDEDDDGVGGILQKRDKTKEELQKEEDDYLAWLAGQKETVPNEEVKELEPLKEYWSSNKLSKDDQFLKDYILNKRYLQNDDIPTYDEIVGNISEDEKELEKQEEFEYKYNYRFEEPDQEFLKRYPRTIPDSVRAVDNKRKEKRKEREERKQQEKLLRKKELDELNKLKKQEIEEKLLKLKSVSQNEKFNLKEDDLESEFDPDEHDRRMAEAFDDQYYMINEGEQKPEFPELDQELGIEDWDNFDIEKSENQNDEEEAGDVDPHCEDDDFIMDCDYDPEAAKVEKSKKLQDELIESTRSKRKKRKRASKLAEIIKMEKPVYDPVDKTYEEYLDEYYKLDYEDIIGDTPCRFKYVETTPNDFGLTVEEILMASNKELNQWASLKKTMQILPKNVEMNEYYKYKKRANNEALKRKIFKSLYGPQEDEQLDENIQEKVEIKVPESEKPIKTESKKRKKRNKGTTNVDPKVQTQENRKIETPIKSENDENVTNESKTSQKNKRKLETSDIESESIEKNKKSKKKRVTQNGNDTKSDEVESRKPDVQNITEKSPKKLKTKVGNGLKPQFKNKVPKKEGKIMHKNDKKPFKSNKNTSNKKEFGKKKLNFTPNTGNPISDLSENRLRAFGIKPKQFYNKLKYGPGSQQHKNKAMNGAANAKNFKKGQKPQEKTKKNKKTSVSES